MLPFVSSLQMSYGSIIYHELGILKFNVIQDGHLLVAFLSTFEELYVLF